MFEEKLREIEGKTKLMSNSKELWATDSCLSTTFFLLPSLCENILQKEKRE